MTPDLDRTALLSLANRLADVARGNGDGSPIDHDHVPADCGVCNQIADEIQQFIEAEALRAASRPTPTWFDALTALSMNMLEKFVVYMTTEGGAPSRYAVYMLLIQGVAVLFALVLASAWTIAVLLWGA